ncbi:GTPase Era [Peptoniphilus sp. oral taxon 386]|uniref:GTPase Era n=1 Tax=Peptoniphilus sp. oral taxon 386 TaxID=652713 RepID=UPI0001DA9BC9|nr:GTPase Era [Peptoniphilus sp. oral taxon 386]EFI42379.1 ribosome biogenesis GTPase Era [Peptoniphilus sp. oral taxon 386 str. F0131]
MFKSGFVTIIGRPNVGKSTLLNCIVGQKISAISNKAQTTRNKITFIYTDEKMQVIFLDTPGIQMPKNKLGDYMLKVSESTLSEVDVITYIVDCSKKIGKLDNYIIKELKEKNLKTPIVLLVNKIDEVAKEELFEIIKMYDDIGIFKEIIPISALKNDGVESYLKTLAKYIPIGPMYYPEDMVTDHPEKFIVGEIIREKALRFLDEEIPHGIAVSIEKMRERKEKEITDIEAVIYIERESHKKIVIGKNGQMLKKIGSAARTEIENLLDTKVNLNLWVKVEKNWRDLDNKVKYFGYK